MRTTNNLFALFSLAACLLLVFGFSVDAAPAPELDVLTDALQKITSPPSTEAQPVSTTPKGEPAAKDYSWGGNRDVYWKKSTDDEALLEQRSSTAKKAAAHKQTKSHKKHSKSSKKEASKEKMHNKAKNTAGAEADKPAGSTGSGVQPAGDWGFGGGWGTYY